jgi:putative ABC transport system permease protein
MILMSVVSQSFQSLTSNRLRSVLTMLGVIWGTASVVFLLGWGRGFVTVMQHEARVVGDGYIMLSPKRAKSEIGGRKSARQLKFQLKDVASILDHCPSVRYITPYDAAWTLIKNGSRLKRGHIKAVGIDAPNIYNLQIEDGRFLQHEDIRNRRRVIVLGADLNEALFPAGYSALGSSVKVFGLTFDVIGVLKKKGQQLVDMGGMDDEKAYIPITSYMQYFRGNKNISEIHVQPGDTSQSKACLAELRSTLAKELGFPPSDEDAIEVFDLAAMIGSLDVMALIIAAFVTFVGIITLFVGGVGVMNIMLISVTERTREIGIRKAIGAKRRQILVQFIAESLTITGLSGIIGIALGCGICIGFAAVPRPSILAAPEISVFTLVSSFLVMLLIGLFAGTLPALRAARLDPVQALRF